ncbi:MAG: tail fiber domain-containing protein [Chthoniobacterales bacterium]
MHQPIQFQTTVQNSISRWLPLRRSLVLIPLVLACFGFSPAMQAVSPPPDGGYTGANTAEGTQALQSLTTGLDNTAIGYQALFSTTTGSFNTAAGYLALRSNTTGTRNTAIGYQALYLNTTGSFSVGIGLNTLFHNTTGSFNSANGYYALYNNTTGSSNVANGLNALYANTSGSNNTANGFKALFSNTTGQENNAVGAFALMSNVGGSFNNAVGRNALFNSIGDENNTMGDDAMYNITTGSHNTAMGDDALDQCTDGDSNVAIGDEAGTAVVHGSNIIVIGANVNGGGPFQDFDDTCYIGSIYSQPVSDSGSAQSVYVDQYNVLGFLPSSQRFKHDITPMDKASEVLYGLKPVTFKYNSDKAGRTQYGVIAEEVAKVAPDLVFRDKDGTVETVRFEQISAMLLNEFLKEHKKVRNLEAIVAQQAKGMEALTAQLKEQAAQIQKVSAQVELNKHVPRTVANR